MTLKEAISRLKDLKVYAEGEITVYDTMREDDDNVWIGDAQALEVAIKALETVSRMENNRALFAGEVLAGMPLEKSANVAISALASVELAYKYGPDLTKIANPGVITEAGQFWQSNIVKMLDQRLKGKTK